MYVAAPEAYAPSASVVVPRQDASESMFALPILKVAFFAVVGGEHGQFAVGVDVPCVDSESVASVCVVVHLLQDMKILECAGTVAFGRVVLAYDVVVVVVDVDLLVVVGVFVVVGRR